MFRYETFKMFVKSHSMKNLQTIYEAGDQVAVFTGKLYETLAHHGVVISPSQYGDSESLVYIPAIDCYCMADDEALLRTTNANQKPDSFAQIRFTKFDGNEVSGTYRRFLGVESDFLIVESENGGFGFDITAPIEGTGLGRISLIIRVPSVSDLTDRKCLDILRDVLSLDYVTRQTTDPNSKSSG